MTGSAAAGFFACLERDDLIAASQTLGALLSDGAPMSSVIDEVVVPVLVEVGLRWETNRWTIALEHAVTGTVDAALAAVEGRYPSARNAGRPVAVACADGEWHTLPGRLAAARLRAEGHNVVFLGPSSPDHLHDHLRSARAGVLALSCTLAANLVGARRSIEAAHAVGVPVMVGGAAFDRAGRRANAIGADADAFNGSPGTTSFLESPSLRNWHESRAKARNRREAFDVEVALEAVVDAAMAQVAVHDPWRGALEHGSRADIRDLVKWTLRFGASSIDLADPSVFTEYLHWTQGLLRCRNIPEQALPVLLTCVHRASRARFPRTADLMLHQV